MSYTQRGHKLNFLNEFFCRVGKCFVAHHHRFGGQRPFVAHPT